MSQEALAVLKQPGAIAMSVGVAEIQVVTFDDMLHDVQDGSETCSPTCVARTQALLTAPPTDEGRKKEGKKVWQIVHIAFAS